MSADTVTQRPAMIRYQELEAAVRTVAAQHPHRIYPFTGNQICLYVPTDSTPFGCVIGEALALCGMSQDELNVLSHLRAPAPHDSVNTGWGMLSVRRHLAGRVESAALNSAWLQQVRRSQDMAATLADAVRIADETFGLQDRVDDGEEDE